MEQTVTGSNGRDEQSARNMSAAASLRALAEDLTLLVKQEGMLFQAETGRRIARSQLEIAVFGAGAALLYAGLLAVVAAIVLGLAETMPAWAAALVSAGIFFVVGLVALYAGKKRLSRDPITPQQSVESVKEDVRTVSEAL